MVPGSANERASTPTRLGARVKLLRTERGWSAQRLADECARLGHAGLSRGTIAKIESGVRKSVTAEEIDVLGRVFGVKLDALVRGRDVASLMSLLFDDEPSARAILEDIGFTYERQFQWETPIAFWRAMLQQLESGRIVDGMQLLIEAAAERYPGNRQLRDMRTERTGDQADRDLPPPQVMERDGSYPTLILTGTDLTDEFLNAVRVETGGRGEVIYTAGDSAAVWIPDPQDAPTGLVNRIRHAMQVLEPNSEVNFQRYPFRPYLLQRLVAIGPDNQAYELRNVPATTLVADVAHAVMQEAGLRQQDHVRMAVSRIASDGSVERLDPSTSLHENDVRDRDELKVGAEATAGGSRDRVPTGEVPPTQLPELTEAHADRLAQKVLDLALSEGLSQRQAQRISVLVAELLLRERLTQLLTKAGVPMHISDSSSEIGQFMPLQQVLDAIGGTRANTEPEQIEG